jgi:ABC-type multidrug transport system fused ATPase/permease subunit
MLLAGFNRAHQVLLLSRQNSSSTAKSPDLPLILFTLLSEFWSQRFLAVYSGQSAGKELVVVFEGIFSLVGFNIRLYLQAVLRQNIAFFDRLGAGEVTNRISNDAELVREGISEKVRLILPD